MFNGLVNLLYLLAQWLHNRSFLPHQWPFIVACHIHFKARLGYDALETYIILWDLTSASLNEPFIKFHITQKSLFCITAW